MMNLHESQTPFSLKPEYDSDFELFEPADDNGADVYDDAHAMAALASGSTATRRLETEALTPQPPQPSAEERTTKLIETMGERGNILLDVLELCRDPQPVGLVNRRIDERQEHDFSVYSPAVLCQALVRAGALRHVAEDGTEIDRGTRGAHPVDIDGEQYLEAEQSQATYWATTEAGLHVLEDNQPIDRIHALFAENMAYLPVYQRVLTLCSQDGGISMADLKQEVDDDPLLQQPRLYASYFADQLERCEALTWKRRWMTTDIGKLALAELG